MRLWKSGVLSKFTHNLSQQISSTITKHLSLQKKFFLILVKSKTLIPKCILDASISFYYQRLFSLDYLNASFLMVFLFLLSFLSSFPSKSRMIHQTMLISTLNHTSTLPIPLARSLVGRLPDSLPYQALSNLSAFTYTLSFA